MPDEIAQRKRCDDFWRFGPLFEDVRGQLRDNRAEKIRFNRESQISEGDFFILDGVRQRGQALIDTQSGWLVSWISGGYSVSVTGYLEYSVEVTDLLEGWGWFLCFI
ncbi:MAG: hypothetical protein R3296_00685 [Oleiphilaceae bacterium]|nr:hypothetical protein [Oleiphilaceae bacterium]